MGVFEWLLIALIAFSAKAEVLPKDERCVTAVYSAYNYISFVGLPARGMWDTRCQNSLKVTSIYAASQIHCHEKELAIGLAQLAALCQEFGHLELLSRDVVAENLTDDRIRTMRIVDYLQLNQGENENEPILISSSYFSLILRCKAWLFTDLNFSLARIRGNLKIGHIMHLGRAQWKIIYFGYAYWCIILVLGISYRLWRWILFNHRGYHVGHGIESNIHPLNCTWIALPWLRHAFHWVQTHLIISPPLANQGRKFIGHTFSTRAEALVVAGFWIISITLSFVGYRTFPGNIYWPDVTSQILRYSADRTGIMAFANLPLLWLLGGRNNILIWATGWSFATFNTFHRHVARIATLQAASVVIILVLVTSLDRIRFANYELFLGHEYWKYLWPSVAVWLIDRGIRIVRILYCNIHVGLSSQNMIRVTKSQMTYDEAADVIRLEVTPGTDLLRPSPGDYYFLYQPLRLIGWENHPFTVGSWTYQLVSRRTSSGLFTAHGQSTEVDRVPLLPEISQRHETQNMTEETFEDIKVLNLKLVFWIRPYNGWTGQLRRQCLGSKVSPVDTTILLEGPYGHNFPLWQYESVLMIMGGTGIASAVPYLQDHLRRCAKGRDETTGEKSRTRDIELVWTAKQSAFIHNVAQRELEPLLGRNDFSASFYTTQPENESFEDLHELGYIIQTGRPHIQSLIMSRACDASSVGVKLAILVCGPSGMADEARAAASSAMRQGYRSIKYLEESFAW
ncbi:hypothetical protein N7462_010993 [Penicillium macrosclerotiorum]|uniref:uncharacterized protein n=1 Tax=Penicillium macrosclerotiorum TaxID=303699 RepID=UPI0025478AA1|nr:uncharacterized protein N7462_010993 [Penicillium macrosclerotiorum]KAJ5666584.1 hypothetical protein N7462_010993 [Penicillium macrosclerotiorum]